MRGLLKSGKLFLAHNHEDRKVQDILSNSVFHLFFVVFRLRVIAVLLPFVSPAFLAAISVLCFLCLFVADPAVKKEIPIVSS